MLNLKHEVLLRLRAIELIAFWEGRLITTCSGQPIPDSGLSFSSATAGGSPSLN